MTETELIIALQEHDVRAFRALIQDYAEDMILLAYFLLQDRDRAEMTVDSILYNLWTTDEIHGVILPLHSYLFFRVRYACGYPS